MFDVKLDPLRRRLIISSSGSSQKELNDLAAKMRKRDMAHQIDYNSDDGQRIIVTIPTTKFISAVDTFSTEQKAGV